MHQVAVYNLTPIMQSHSHGTHAKDMLVLHETVSKDAAGLADITNVAKDLARRDYGIHGMTDLEGHKAWAKGMGNAIFWHCGGVNERSVGIEQVSYIPALIQAKMLSLEEAHRHWLARKRQLDATAQLIATWHFADKKLHPVKESNGISPGVTTHWHVSQHFPASEGHWDCRPYTHGGYYPFDLVLNLAKHYCTLEYCL